MPALEIGTAVLIGSAIAGLAGGVMQAITNYKGTKDANQANLDYAEQQNEESWEHSKIALQTKVADAKAAGLSPLAALNSSGAQITTPTQYAAQAPQMDLSQAIASLSSASSEFSSDETKKSIAKLQANQSGTNNANDNSTKMQIAKLQAQNALEICKENITSAEKISSDQLDEQAREADNRLNFDFQTFTENYAFSLENAEYGRTRESQEQVSQACEMTAKSLSNLCSNFDIPFRVEPYDIYNKQDLEDMQIVNDHTFNRIKSRYEIYSSKFKNLSEADKSKGYMQSSSMSETNSDSFGGSVGVHPKVKGLKLPLGADLGLNRSWTDAEGNSFTKSFQKSRMAEDWDFKKLFIGYDDAGNRMGTVVYHIPRFHNGVNGLYAPKSLQKFRERSR